MKFILLFIILLVTFSVFFKDNEQKIEKKAVHLKDKDFYNLLHENRIPENNNGMRITLPNDINPNKPFIVKTDKDRCYLIKYDEKVISGINIIKSVDCND